MAAVPLAIMAIGTITQAVGAIKQGQAAEQAGKYNSAVALQNSGIAQEQGELAVMQQQKEAQKKMGSATAQYGASGLDSSEGSPLDVLRASAEQSSLDASTIRYNYALKSAGYQQNATIEDYSGKNAVDNSYYSAAGSILSGGAKIASKGLD